MNDGELTLAALAQRVFFQTQEIEDVLEMLDECVDSIFKQSDRYQKVQLSLSEISPNAASGVIILQNDADGFGATGFNLKREEGLINGQCYNDSLFKKYNLNSRDGLAEFAAIIYEDAAKNLAKNEAVKRFEARRKPT